MSRTRRQNDNYSDKERRPVGRRQRRDISARAVRRADPDLRRMGRALITFVLAEAEAEAAKAAKEAATDDGTDSHTESEAPSGD
jgi:hypothetical protein